jgi:hypothetical protein
LNLRKGIRIDVAEEDILPGDAALSYLKMPCCDVVVGSLHQALYALLMPIIGIVTWQLWQCAAFSGNVQPGRKDRFFDGDRERLLIRKKKETG